MIYCGILLHFPLPPRVLSISDANWGPQDATQTKSTKELPLFTSRSMSAFHIDLFGPLHWLSKCQLVTAGSSVEAEIYAPNECVKFLLELNQIFIFLDSHHIFMPSMNVNYNDNQACINWSKFSTTKGHCRIQMKENRVHEKVSTQFVQVCPIDGKINLADIFMKEMKDITLTLLNFMIA